MQQLSCTLVIFSTVAVFHLVKTSQARVVAGVCLWIAATVRLSGDGHCTGDWRDHYCWKVCLGVWITVLESNNIDRKTKCKCQQHFLCNKTAPPLMSGYYISRIGHWIGKYMHLWDLILKSRHYVEFLSVEKCFVLLQYMQTADISINKHTLFIMAIGKLEAVGLSWLSEVNFASSWWHIRSPPWSVNKWHHVTPTSLICTELYVWRKTAAPVCLPLGGRSSTQAPEHQHPVVTHPKRIAMHDCSCFAWTWQQQSLTSRRAWQSDQVSIQMLEEPHLSICWNTKRLHITIYKYMLRGMDIEDWCGT